MAISEDVIKTLMDVIESADMAYQSPNIPMGMEAYVRQCLVPQLEEHELIVAHLERVGVMDEDALEALTNHRDFVTAVHIAFDRNSRPRLTVEVT